MDIGQVQAHLDKHFKLVDKIILSRQDPITGLLPASTAINAHGDYTDAWVRDNVYSIMGVWGLAMAYKKYEPAHHRSHLLSQSVVKLMRGLMIAMMRQADHVETFKHTLNPSDALHAKYGTNTGLPVVGDDEWGHLQLDATSLFLLMMAQMTASGLHIVYTIDEVNFVQNLVHYISRTYCTSDYGIWERGNKINHGTTEINGSSVGMAKAALEVMDGFNLFGNAAGQEAIIHVIPTDIARLRFTLENLLPRESNSKETDAALLSIIGYPAYAVEDEAILERTSGKIIKKLAGRYGCKRFLLDGHQSSIEDESRLHYEPSELREFEDIESEWPLFFTYLLLDALIREDKDAVKEWRERLTPLFIEQEGVALLPELYIVPKESIEAEKANPNSQTRIPNENIPLVWAQSLYMLSEMMIDGILLPADIDPLKRVSRIGHQRTTHPLVAVLAEDESIKQELLNLGFESESVDEVKPLKVMHASELAKAHTLIGKNDKLELSGKPLVVARTMTTARLHVVVGEEMIFLPYYFNPLGFYFSYDNTLLVEQFRGSIKFLAQNWNQVGQPIVPFLVRRDMLEDSNKEALLSLLHDFQNNICNDVAITTGKLSQLRNTASVERIDNLHGLIFSEMDFSTRIEGECGSQEERNHQAPLEPDVLYQLEISENDALAEMILHSDNRRKQAYALDLLWQRKGAEYEIEEDGKGIPLYLVARRLYAIATSCHDWAVIRRLANTTGKYDDRLEDVLLDIVIGQKRLAVGRAYSPKATFSKPMETVAIVKTIATYCGNNVGERVLTQEIILHLGHLTRTKPELFENMLTLRTWYFVQLLVGHISRENGIPLGDAYEHLLGLAPFEVYEKLRFILIRFRKESSHLGALENLRSQELENFNAQSADELEIEGTSEVKDWALWRQQAGMLSHFTPRFYKSVWYMLQQCTGIVIGDKYNVSNRLSSELTLDVTAGERSFELRIDNLLQNIDTPDYRQLNIEAMESLARVFKNNTTMIVENDLVLDVLIGHAVRIAWEKRGSENYDEERSNAWESFYRLSPRECDKAFVKAFDFLLHADGVVIVEGDVS